MPTIPTGKMELELRKLYIRWVENLPKTKAPSQESLKWFQDKSIELIERMGGDIARLGVVADFPAPRFLDLSPHIGTIYNDMEQAAIQAAIGTGLNPNVATRAMMRAGMDKSYRRLNRLARTETVSAYWKNAWDSIEGLGLVMVWGAENGPRTCAWCKERDGMVMDSPELRDHPNGRCTPLPTHPSQVQYKGSVGPNGVIYQDPAWKKMSTEPLTETTQKPFTAEEVAFMEEYQKGRYDLINAALRGDQPLSDLSADVSSAISGLDSLMDRYTVNQTTVVTRRQGPEGLFKELGIQLRSGTVEAQFPGVPQEAIDVMYKVAKDSGVTANWADWDLEDLIGKKWKQNAYLSTSEGVVPGAFTGKIEMKIEVPKGTHALRMASDYEEELLLDRGLEYEVTGAKWNEERGILELAMRVITKKRK